MFKGISIGSFLGCCGIKNRFLKSTILYPPSASTCYVFEFDTLDINNEITSITYDNGTQAVGGMTVSLSALQTTDQIEAAIEMQFSAVTYDDVTVRRVPIGVGLFTYTITFRNPNLTIDILDISGNAYASNVTNCS